MTAPPAPRSITSGPPGFITIANVRNLTTGTTVGFQFDTDQLCVCAMDWIRVDPPADPGQPPLQGTASETGPTYRHVLWSGTPLLPGQTVQVAIRLDASDTSGLELRPYITQVRTINSRMNPTPVPVQFFQFGWSNYNWAQYNPSPQVAAQILSATATPVNPPPQAQVRWNWTTDVPTTGVVEWGPTTAYGSTLSPTALGTSGTTSIGVSGLPPNMISNTTYHWRVRVTTAGGALTLSPDATVTAPAVG